MSAPRLPLRIGRSQGRDGIIAALFSPRAALQRLLEAARRTAPSQWTLTRADVHGFALAVLLPILAGVVAQVFVALFGITQLSFVFLTAVICVGAFFGARPGVLAALTAFAIYNFFLVEPRFSLQLATADDFVTLVLFLAAALATVSLAGRMRDQARVSERRLKVTEALFEASRGLALAVEASQVHTALAASAAKALGLRAVVMELKPSGVWEHSASVSSVPLAADELSHLSSLCDTSDPSLRWRVEFVRGRQAVLAALAVETVLARSLSFEDEQTLASLAVLGAVALERSALIAAMAEAQTLAEGERLRSAMLSSLSHDFRTPLSAILASSTTLLDFAEDLNAGAKNELLRSIHEETERMTRFVSNLLDMTKLDAGALRPNIVQADLGDIAADAAAHVARLAGERSVRIVRLGPSISAEVDPVLLEQALVNILANAVDFSPVGGCVEIALSKNARHGARVEITDNGPGIPKASLTRVFEKFYRVPDQNGERRSVGLGLSISKSLIEAMGGAVHAESPLHEGTNPRGSRFIIEFDQKKAATL